MNNKIPVFSLMMLTMILVSALLGGCSTEPTVTVTPPPSITPIVITVTATVESPLPTPTIVSPLPTPETQSTPPPDSPGADKLVGTIPRQLQSQEEPNMSELGTIGTVEITFMVIGLVQLICYLVNEKDNDVQRIGGKGKVLIALAIGLPLLALREVIAGEYLNQETVNIIILIVRVVGDGLAIPGLVGFVKELVKV